MTLDALKEEYKKSIKARQMADEDYEQLVEEIDQADTLDEFIKVVGLWAIPKGNESVERIILDRLLTVETLPKQKSEKIEDVLGNYLSEDEENYPKIINALKKALKKNPNEMVDNVEYDAGDESEVRMETITMWEPFEYTLTVKQLCESIGLE